MKFLLTIAASDGSGCAGVQQDLRVMDRLGYRGLSVLSGITLQTLEKLDSLEPLSNESFEAQLKHYLSHFPLKGIKLGALCSIAQVEIAARCLQHRGDVPLVADPVFAPSRGRAFLDTEGIERYRKLLLPQIDLLVPNQPEWKVLNSSEMSDSGMPESAPRHLYISGGHSPERKILGCSFLQEEFRSGDYSKLYYRRKQPWKYSRGTGCAFSSAACAFMADGHSPEQACRKAGLWMNRYYRELNRNN